MRVTAPLLTTIVLLTATACGGGVDDDPYGLPARNQSVDTTGITDEFRASGGNVLVTLTGAPGSEALDALQAAGLHAPDSESGSPVVLAPLAPETVFGRSSAEAVRGIAGLSFVLLIEPSVNADGIAPF